MRSLASATRRGVTVTARTLPSGNVAFEAVRRRWRQRLVVPPAWVRDHDANNFEAATLQRKDPALRTPLKKPKPAAPASPPPAHVRVQHCDVPVAAVAAGIASRYPTAKAQAAALTRALGNGAGRGPTGERDLHAAFGRAPQQLLALWAEAAGSPRNQGTLQRDASRDVALRQAYAATGVAPSKSDKPPARATAVQQWALGGSRDGAPTAAQHRGLMKRLLKFGFAVVRDPAMAASPSARHKAPRRRELTALEDEATADPVYAHADPVVRLRALGVARVLRGTFGVVRHTHYGGIATWGSADTKPLPKRRGSLAGGNKATGVTGDPPAHLDTAYMKNAIALHTDNTYWLEAPKLQAFANIHRTRDTVGGSNTLCDGFAVARTLRAEHPAFFKLLSTVPVPARYHKEGHGFVAARPVITASADGREIRQISYNSYDRAPLTVGAPYFPNAAAIDQFYAAYECFAALARSRRHAVSLDLALGEMLLFDNHRVLHARGQFAGPRIMCGAYVGLDEFASAASRAPGALSRLP